MLFAVGILFFFFYLCRKAKKPIYTFDVDSSSLSSVSLVIAYWSLIFLMIICFLGDAAPIIGGLFRENPMTTSPEFYNKWCFPFTLAFVVALAGCNIGLKMKRYVMLIVAVLGIGAVLAAFGQPTPNPLANLGLPLLMVAGIAIAYNFARLLSKKNSSSRLKMDVAIEEGGKVHNESLWMYYYTNHGVVSEPSIISTLAGDVYVSMHPTSSSFNSMFYALMGQEVQPEDSVIVVKRVPLIWLVWFGIILLGIGMTVLLLGELSKITHSQYYQKP
jgi:cytochrome c biogenesis factor